MPNLLIRRAFAPASAPTTPYDVRAALAGAGATIVDEVLFPARPARHQAPPEGLHRQVEQLLRAGSPLYTHQAKAIALAETGHNVVLATRTASGKTRVATAAAIIRLLRDPHARVLCLYPTKALQADQEQKWRAATRGLDLPTVVLSGDTSSSDRVRLLEQSRIILANPDIMHSWWMAHLADPRLQSILATVALIFVDEAHVYEGAFGSNVAMLMRRLRAVHRGQRPLQFVAASATIDDPVGHAQRLCGVPFSLVGADDDGAPSSALRVVLCRAAPSPSTEGRLLAATMEACPQTVLAFKDSRQGVETTLQGALKAFGLPPKDASGRQGGSDFVRTLTTARRGQHGAVPADGHTKAVVENLDARGAPALPGDKYRVAVDDQFTRPMLHCQSLPEILCSARRPTGRLRDRGRTRQSDEEGETPHRRRSVR